MFIKLSLALVVMALAAVAAEDDHLIQVIESEVLDGEEVLEKLLGQEPLSANETAILIARTKDKIYVPVVSYNLRRLADLNNFEIGHCQAHTFVAFDWAREITFYPNLKKYYDEVMRLRKDRCKKSLDVVFFSAIKSNLELRAYVTKLRKFEDKCKAVGYDMASTMCLEDFLSLKSSESVCSLRDECERFASQVNEAIRTYDLDRESPFGDLAQSHPWLTTAARDCAQMVEVAEKLRLLDRNSKKQKNRRL
jgi:hypothetical protein